MIKWLIVVTFLKMANPIEDATVEMAHNYWGTEYPQLEAPYFKSFQDCESELLKIYQRKVSENQYKWKLNNVDRTLMSFMDSSGKVKQKSSVAFYHTKYWEENGKEKMAVYYHQCVPIVYK